MYAYLKGILADVEEDCIVVEIQGIGYNVKMSIAQNPLFPSIGQELKIYTYTSVREDAIWLYGFLTKEELNLFRLLITVNGVGPKAAQAVLSSIPADDLRFAIYTGDVKQLSKAPGVGAKTAQRIILDLKDKISIDDNLPGESETAETGAAVHGSGIQKEAIEALVALGYSQTDAAKAITKIAVTEDMDVEELLKKALKQFALF